MLVCSYIRQLKMDIAKHRLRFRDAGVPGSSDLGIGAGLAQDARDHRN